MTDNEFSRLTSSFLDEIQSMTPINKNFKAPTRGNLRMRATRGKAIAHGKYVVSVSARIAPYFPYVNYQEKFESGKPNPNYQYLENAIDTAINNLARKAGGFIVRG